MHRVLALILAIAMCVFLFAGCGKSKGSDKPAKVVFAMKTFNVVPTTEIAKTVSDEVNRYIQEKYPGINLELEWILYGPGDYDKKVRKMIQDGDRLDIFIPPSITDALIANQLAPVTMALENYGQDLMKTLRTVCGENIFGTVTQNGEIMAIPVNKNMALAPCIQYDADMLTSAGFTGDDITDMASLDAIFSEVRKLSDECYPFVSTDAANRNLPDYFYAFHKIDTLGNNFGGVFEGSNTVVNVFESEAYLEMCRQMKSWHDNNFMPQDMANSAMRGVEYMTAGIGFCTYASYDDREDYTDLGTVLTARFGRTIEVKKLCEPYLTTDYDASVLGIPRNSKSVDAAVQFLNIAYTDPYVYNTLLWGLEGRDYVKITDATVDYPEGLNGDTVPYCACMTMGEWGTESIGWSLEQGKTAEQKASDLAYVQTINRQATTSPYYGFRFDGSGVKDEIAALTDVYERYAYSLMCGNVDVEPTLAEFNQQLYAAGLQTVINAKQEQLNAWLSRDKES